MDIKKLLMWRTSSFAKNALVLLSSNYLSTLIGLATTVVAAHILGSELYGYTAIIIAYPSLFNNICNVKSPDIIIRYICDFKEKNDQKKLKTICKLGYLIDLSGASFVLISVLIFSVFGFEEIRTTGYLDLLLFYAFSLVFLSLLKTSKAILVSFESFKALSRLAILSKFISFLFVLIILLSGFGISGYIVGLGIGNIITGLLGLFIANKTLENHGYKRWINESIYELRPIFKELRSLFGWNYWILSFRSIVEQVPIIILGKYVSAESAGFFKISQIFVSLARTIQVSLSTVLYPRISKLVSIKDYRLLKLTLITFTKKTGILIFGLIMIGIAIVPYFIPLVYGSDFKDATVGIQIIMVAVAFHSLFFWVNPLYYALGKLKTFGIVFSSYAVFVLLFIVPITKRFEFIGTTTLIAFGMILFYLVLLFNIKKYFKYELNTDDFSFLNENKCAGQSVR